MNVVGDLQINASRNAQAEMSICRRIKRHLGGNIDTQPVVYAKNGRNARLNVTDEIGRGTVEKQSHTDAEIDRPCFQNPTCNGHSTGPWGQMRIYIKRNELKLGL